MSKNMLFRKGLDEINSKYLQDQIGMITPIAEDVRKIKNIDTILKAEGFFVPNNDFMSETFGAEIKENKYDCYYDGYCMWNHYLVFPVYDIGGNIQGFSGFNPFTKLENKQGGSGNAYRHSSIILMDKGRNFFQVKGTLRKALEDDYIIIVDGLFDTLSLYENGFNSASLMGSNLSKYQIAYLKLVKKVYVCMDSDNAGTALVDRLRRNLKNVSTIKFNKFKDVDDVLKSENKVEFVRKLKEHISKESNLDLVFRFK